MGRYIVTRPFVASVDGVEITLEPGEIIPGPRVPEIESWGRSVHHLENIRKIAPYVEVDTSELPDDQVVASRGDALLEHFETSALLAELERRDPTAESEAEVEGEDADLEGKDGEPEAEADPDGEPPAEETASKPSPRSKTPKA